MTSTCSTASSSGKQKESTTFKVYYRHNQSLIQLKFSDVRMRVEQVISKSIEILSDTYMVKVNTNYMHYAVFPALKNGEKMPDSLEISHGQRIKGVGVKRFYLQYLNLSKSSISTEINLQFKYGFQKKAKKQMHGCCSIFSF